nr:sigma factor binding protein 1, chloroplastic [Ipomoea batatas]
MINFSQTIAIDLPVANQNQSVFPHDSELELSEQLQKLAFLFSSSASCSKESNVGEVVDGGGELLDGGEVGGDAFEPQHLHVADWFPPTGNQSATFASSRGLVLRNQSDWFRFQSRTGFAKPVRLVPIPVADWFRENQSAVRLVSIPVADWFRETNPAGFDSSRGLVSRNQSDWIRFQSRTVISMESWKQAGQRQNPSKKVGKEPIIKVKYISSPVMVNARSASEFRAIVQQLTGKDDSPAADHAKAIISEIDLSVAEK